MKRYAGRGCESLTRRGRSQAKRIAKDLERAAPSTIYSSRIVRARETADAIGRVHGLAVRPDARLDELLMGPWEGLSESEIADRYPCEWDLWHSHPHELSLPGRETLREVEDRIISIVREASLAGPSILVTHVAPMRVATLSLLRYPLSDYKRVDVPNASCIRLDLTNATALRYPSGLCVRSELTGQDGELAIA